MARTDLTENKKVYAVISKDTQDISSQRSSDNAETYTETTASLASLYPNTEGLDKYIKSDTSNPEHFSDYIFTGLLLVVTDNDFTLDDRANVTILPISNGTNLCQESLLPAIASGVGANSLVFGNGKTVKANGDNSVAAGDTVHANGKNSFASGQGLVAYNKNQTVVGQFNQILENEEGADSLFVVGGGTDGENRRDSLVVTKTNLYLQGVPVDRLFVKKDSLADCFESKACYNNAIADGIAGNYEEYSHYLKVAAQALKLVNSENRAVDLALPDDDKRVMDEEAKTQPILYFRNGFATRSGVTVGSNEQPAYLNRGALTVLRLVNLGKGIEEKNVIPAIEYLAKEDTIFAGNKTFNNSITVKGGINIKAGAELALGDKIAIKGNKAVLTITGNPSISGELSFSDTVTIPNIKLTNVNSATTFKQPITLYSEERDSANLIFRYYATDDKKSYDYQISADETKLSLSCDSKDLKILASKTTFASQVEINGGTEINGTLTVTGEINAATTNLAIQDIKAKRLVNTPTLQVKIDDTNYRLLAQDSRDSGGVAINITDMAPFVLTTNNLTDDTLIKTVGAVAKFTAKRIEFTKELDMGNQAIMAIKGLKATGKIDLSGASEVLVPSVTL